MTLASEEGFDWAALESPRCTSLRRRTPVIPAPGLPKAKRRRLRSRALVARHLGGAHYVAITGAGKECG